MSISPEVQYLLVIGDLNDGHEFIGPFASFDDASNYSLKHVERQETWITPMFRPLEKGRDYD